MGKPSAFDRVLMAHTLTSVDIRLRRYTESPRWTYEGNAFQRLIDPEDLDLGPFPEDLNLDELCQEFLELDVHDSQKVLAFLNKTGEWEKDENVVSLDSLEEEQVRIRAVMLDEKHRPPQPTFQDALDTLAPPYQRAPIYVERFQAPVGRRPGELEIGVYDTRTALYLTLWIQKLKSAKFRYCKRFDCPDHGPGKRPFSVTRPDKYYCSQYCAHLESLRKKRAETSGTMQRKQRKKESESHGDLQAWFDLLVQVHLQW